jgi:putative glycosyltransferase (TIGR04348 family)
MLALHARRVHASIAAYARAWPERPLILVLTGTDLYRDIHVDELAQASLRLARGIVLLQARGLDELPEAARAKTRVIHQSAPALKPRARPKRHFEVCVVAHMRDEKDPLRAGLACDGLPATSRIRVTHIGGVLQTDLDESARALATRQPRWRWLGPRVHGETRRRIAGAHLLVVSSRMEGGANVICEAVQAGTPVIASDIPGNRGMLGEDYAGYYPVGDTAALTACMARAEADPVFYARIRAQCAARALLFEPAREAAAVQGLLT